MRAVHCDGITSVLKKPKPKPLSRAQTTTDTMFTDILNDKRRMQYDFAQKAATVSLLTLNGNSSPYSTAKTGLHQVVLVVVCILSRVWECNDSHS